MEEEQQAERDRKEQEKLESLKKKDKHEQSKSRFFFPSGIFETGNFLVPTESCVSGAVASSEVKQRLQEFVLNKKQREAAAHSANTSPSGVQNW